MVSADTGTMLSTIPSTQSPDIMLRVSCEWDGLFHSKMGKEGKGVMEDEERKRRMFLD